MYNNDYISLAQWETAAKSNDAVALEKGKAVSSGKTLQYWTAEFFTLNDNELRYKSSHHA